MVGHLGDPALAGDGIGGQLFFLWVAVTLGLGAGVQAMVARRVGEGRPELTGRVLNAGVLLACVAGVLLVALGYSLLPLTFGTINNDPAVVDRGVDYLSTRIGWRAFRPSVPIAVLRAEQDTAESEREGRWGSVSISYSTAYIRRD